MTIKPMYYILCGLPATGKSTFVNNLLNMEKSDYIHISSDKFIEEAANKAGKCYNDVFLDEIGKSTAKMNEELRNALNTRKNIIHDQTNLTVSKRKKLLAAIPAGYVKVAVVFNPDKETHMKFIDARPEKKIPAHIMESMAKTFELPTMDEGFDDVFEYNYTL